MEIIKRVLNLNQNPQQDIIGGPKLDFIDFDTSYVPSMQEGRIAWDLNEGTVQIGMPGGNVNLQLGQEQHIRAKATETILNGQAVRISGASGNRAEVALVNNLEDVSVDTIAIATENVTSGQNGYFTTFGIVNNINTNHLTEGKSVYLDTTDGALTSTPPTAPSLYVRIGECIVKSATVGKLFVSIYSKEWKRTLYEMQEPTGIPKSQLSNFSISYNHATQVLVLTKINNWFYYYKGLRVSVTGNLTATAHANTYGIYYYYFNDATATISVSNTLFDIPTTAQIAYVIYNPSATDTIKGIAFDERHGCQMDGITHEYLHETNGAVYENGGAIANYVLNTDTVAATTYSISATTFDDEDLETVTAAQTDGSNYVLMWRTAAGLWDWVTGQSLPYIITNNNLTYNPAGSALVEITTTNRYVNFYAVVTNAVSSTFHNIILPSRLLYATLAEAQAESITTYFTRTSFLAEFVPLYKITHHYQTGSSITTGKSKIASVQTIRGSVTITGGVPSTDHLSLSNLSGGTYSDGGHVNLVQQSINASSAPTVNSDIDLFKEGSHWIKQDTNIIYHCVDNADGAAIWIGINQGLLTTDTPTFAGLITSGNVGFGVSATPTVFSVGKTLTLGFDGLGLWSPNLNDFHLFSNYYYNDSKYKYLANGYAQNVSLNNLVGNISFAVSASGTAGNEITWINALTLGATGTATFAGNVTATGIGTFNNASAITPPSLSASTTLVLNKSSANVFQMLSNKTDGTSYIFFGDEDATSTGYIAYENATNAMLFRVNGSATNALAISSGGVITMALQPAGHFWQNTSVFTVNDSTLTTVNFNTTRFDVTSSYSAGVYTIPVAGKYIVTAGINFVAEATGVRNVYIKKGSTTMAASSGAGAAGNATYVNLSAVIDCAVSDQITIQVYTTSGSSVDIDWGGSSFFTIAKVS